MKRKKGKPTDEEIARSEAVWQRLRERIAYHKAKLVDERAQRRDG